MFTFLLRPEPVLAKRWSSHETMVQTGRVRTPVPVGINACRSTFADRLIIRRASEQPCRLPDAEHFSARFPSLCPEPGWVNSALQYENGGAYDFSRVSSAHRGGVSRRQSRSLLRFDMESVSLHVS